MSDHITASPLTWPEGWPRTRKPERSQFGKWNKPVSVHKASCEILEELRKMGIPKKDVIISTNLKLRIDGLPYSGQKQPEDLGVSVWFKQEGQQKVIALDKYDRLADNLWAVAKTIEAMRGIKRWGSGQILERVFTGFTALPPPEGGTAKTWYEYFKFFGYEVESLPDLEHAYKRLARKLHPDRGGSHDAMSTLNRMRKKAQHELVTL